MSTAIVTDSNSGVTREESLAWGVRVVPMPIIIDSVTHYEGVDLFPDQFYRELKGHVHASVTTSQPAPEDILKVWDQVLEDHDELVYIPMSSGLSSSCQTANALAADYGGRVVVADNHQISVPQKNSIRDALTLAQAGYTAPEIKEKLEKGGEDTLIFIGVDTLEFLRKGGRITAAAAAVGSIMGIKPLLVIRGQKLDVYAKVRGVKHCKAQLLEVMRRSVEEYRAKEIPIRIDAAGSFDNKQEEGDWIAAAHGAFPGEEIQYNPLTLSIGTHTGPGAFGMAITRRILP